MQTREKLEERKLELEIADLQRSQIKTPTFWIGVASAIVAVLGTIGQNYLSKIEVAQAKLDQSEAEHGRLEAEGGRAKALGETSALVKQKEALRAERDSLEVAKRQLLLDNTQLEAERNNRQQKLAQLVDATNAVQPAPKSPETAQLKSATAAAANSLYSIGLYSFGAKEDVLRKATDALTKEGYTIIAATSLTDRPSWLAPRPTVFYYRPKAADKARAIARDLERLTGVKFDVTTGSGLGIPKGQEETNLRIHFV